MMTATVLQREFTYNGVRLGDPNSALTADEVSRHYTQQYPDLANAAVTGPENRDGKLVYTFTTKVGDKG